MQEGETNFIRELSQKSYLIWYNQRTIFRYGKNTPISFWLQGFLLAQTTPSVFVRAENFLPQQTLPCGTHPLPQNNGYRCINKKRAVISRP